MFQANRVAAGAAHEVNMIIMMMSTGTVVFTQRVTYRIIRRRDTVDQSFFEEGLQSAVNRNAIKPFARASFNVTMSKGTILLQEKLENFFSAAGYAELITF